MRHVGLLVLVTACSGGPEDSGDDSGTVEVPDIAADATLTWGDVMLGCSSEAVLTVTNEGDAALSLSSITSSSPEFAADSVPPTVGAGQTVQITVVFEPDVLGERTATLTLASDDPDDPSLAVPVSGTCVEATATDALTQPTPRPLDILWIVDASCSMASVVGDDLPLVADGYIHALHLAGVDFQLGLTGVETDAGVLQGDPTVWTSAMTTEDLVGEIDDAIAAIPAGSGTEVPLTAASAALVDPGHAVTDGLVRADADLAILFIGDEDDQSGATAAATVAWMGAYETAPYTVRFDAIMPTEGVANPIDVSGCADFLGLPILDDVVSGTGGHAANLCDGIGEDELTQLGLDAAGVITRLPLSTVPANGTMGMTVTVGGVAPSYDPFGVDGWSYDPTSNTVQLHGSALPDAGDEVVAWYPVATPTCP